MFHVERWAGWVAGALLICTPQPALSGCVRGFWFAAGDVGLVTKVMVVTRGCHKEAEAPSVGVQRGDRVLVSRLEAEPVGRPSGGNRVWVAYLDAGMIREGDLMTVGWHARSVTAMCGSSGLCTEAGYGSLLACYGAWE